jgi:hypothetical protein
MFVLCSVTLYQSRSLKILKARPSRSPSFSLWISKVGRLEHIAPIVIFSIYFVELELNCMIGRSICAPMLEFD